MLNSTLVTSQVASRAFRSAATTASTAAHWHTTTHAHAYAFAAKAATYAFTANKYGKSGTWRVIG